MNNDNDYAKQIKKIHIVANSIRELQSGVAQKSNYHEQLSEDDALEVLLKLSRVT